MSSAPASFWHYLAFSCIASMPLARCTPTLTLGRDRGGAAIAVAAAAATAAAAAATVAAAAAAAAVPVLIIGEMDCGCDGSIEWRQLRAPNIVSQVRAFLFLFCFCASIACVIGVDGWVAERPRVVCDLPLYCIGWAVVGVCSNLASSVVTLFVV